MTRVLVLLVALLAVTCSAASGAVRVTNLKAISGTSPFKPGGCGVAGKPTFDSEAEPSFAVNPKNPRNAIAVWQQDRFVVDGGALSNIVSVTKDGGATWRRVLVPGLSRCTGGPRERTSDPWISIGPDGTAYLATLVFDDDPALAAGGLAGPTDQLVSRSTDGGLTWSAPVTVIANGHYNDREAITADPRKPGVAYEAWVDRLGAFGETGVNMFAKTVDGGATFSTPQANYTAAPLNLPDPTIITVQPNGTLVDVFMLANATAVAPGPDVPFKVMAMRSTDGGATWSQPVTIDEVPPVQPEDESTNTAVRAFPLVSAATAPDGTLYVVYNDIESEHRSRIMISTSSDDGSTFSTPRVVKSVAAQAFIPSVAVDRRGTVGVLWDDFRNDKPGDKALTTDVWFASSSAGGRSFAESHVAGPFDATAASSTSSTSVQGRFIGDYQGFAAYPNGFGAVFAQSRAGVTKGPSDVYFARITPVPGAGGGTIRLRVRPQSVLASSRRRSFRFTASISGSGQALGGALVTFAGARAHTDAHGRVTLRARLKKPGSYRARATASGFRAGAVTVVVRRASHQGEDDE
ncbi:MAG: hypothetical protein QOI19_311 [Thermoleophilaceae bacterium]|nr:hypothetical protein [Thermoleophilaceae bacterium]